MNEHFWMEARTIGQMEEQRIHSSLPTMTEKGVIGMVQSCR